MNHQPKSEKKSKPYKYWAFLSYSTNDSKWAARLAKEIETFRVPKSIKRANPETPTRLAPVFRDRDELSASKSLTERIEKALSNSKFLIVLCSPSSARSDWVEREIDFFLSKNPKENLFLFIVSGDPFSNDTSEVECIPKAFFRSDEDPIGPTPSVPLAPDRVRDGWDNAITKLVAGMLHVEYDTIRQRVRMRKLAANALTLFAAIMFAAVPSILLLDEINLLKETIKVQKLEIIKLNKTIDNYESRAYRK